MQMIYKNFVFCVLRCPIDRWLVLVRLQAAARVVVHVRLARSRLLDVLISNIAVFHNLFLLVAAESFSF